MNITPWAQINGSMPPLIPKQEQQQAPQTVVFAPTRHAAPDLTPLAQISASAPMRQAVFAPAQGMNSDPILAEASQRIGDELMSDWQKDANPYGSANNHPGVFGKILHGLSVAAGGPGRRLFDEHLLTGKRQALDQEQSGEAQKAAQTANENSEAALHGAQTEAAKMVQITPQMASEMGNPSLEGQHVSQGVLQHLLTTGGTNQTKKDIAGAGNETKLTVTQLQDESKEAVAAGRPQPHTITMQGGVPHVMERDPSTGQYSIDRGIAPPNYAQVLPDLLSTKTTEVQGPDNVQHRHQYDPKTQAYDIDMGPAPTGQIAHQIFQAGAIEKLAPQVISDINANRDILGNLSSYYKEWSVGTPVSDPRAAQLMTELMSLAAMQPALHAFRSANAMEAFEKMVGGLSKNPDATIATINGLLKTPEAFTSMPQRSHSASGGTSEGKLYQMNGKRYRYKGGPRGQMSSYEEVKQ